MKDYENIFKQYSIKTNELLDNLYKEDYEMVLEALSDRDLLIENFKELNLDTKIFKEQAVKYNIEDNEAKIKALMTEKMNDIKLEMHKLELGGRANKSYNKGFYDNNKVFNKKV